MVAYIDPVAFAYRTNIQGSTKTTPFELLYGVQATLPQESESVQVQWHSSAEDFAERVVARAEVIRERMNSMHSTAHGSLWLR